MCSRLRIWICGVLLFALAGLVSAELPDLFYSLDIGDVERPGSADEANGIWTVSGSGAGIWGEADDFQFCYTQVSGDATIVARVVSMTGSANEWAKAGIMIRETLQPDSNHAFMALTNNISTAHAASFQWRSIADGDNNKIDEVPSGYVLGDAVWVKIERDEDIVTGYYSMDGEGWDEIGTHTNVMAEDLYIGLAVTSHDEEQLVTGTFDEVLVNGWLRPECQAAQCYSPVNGGTLVPEYEADNVYMILDFEHSPCAFGYWSKGYFSDNKADVDNRDEACSLGTIPDVPSYVHMSYFVVGYDDPTVPVLGKTYYWCVDSWEGDRYIPGPTWSFTPIPKHAWNPSPADDKQLVPTEGTMTWNLGDLDITGIIVQYLIYIGTDEAAVVDASVINNPSVPEYMGWVGTESYDYDLLQPGTEHFWRVDTKLSMTRPPFTSKYITGNVWSFTTVNWLSVDDMETYTNWTIPGNNIFDAWHDGDDICVCGESNYTQSHLTENKDMAFVLGGLQSMKYEFDNDALRHTPCVPCRGVPTLFYSEIEAQTADLPSGIGSDWSVDGIKALQINFMGRTDNPTTEPLWVQLQDSTKGYGSKVFYGTYTGESLEDFKDPNWHEWLIDLADFDVDLNDVVSITIGIGNEDANTPGIYGILYFDEIRLYTPRCIPNRRTPEFATSDQAPEGDPDCKIDAQDLRIMAQNWLLPPEIPNLKDYAELADNWLKTENWPF